MEWREGTDDDATFAVLNYEPSFDLPAGEEWPMTNRNLLSVATGLNHLRLTYPMLDIDYEVTKLGRAVRVRPLGGGALESGLND